MQKKKKKNWKKLCGGFDTVCCESSYAPAGAGGRSMGMQERVLEGLGGPKEKTALQGHCSSERLLTCEHRP